MGFIDLPPTLYSVINHASDSDCEEYLAERSMVSVAYHEAGHCFISELYGVPVKKIELLITEDGASADGMCHIADEMVGKMGDVRISIATAFGGAVAEQIHMRWPKLMLTYGIDFDEIEFFIVAYPAEVIEMLPQVRASLLLHWNTIEEIATALLASDEMTLTADQLKIICDIGDCKFIGAEIGPNISSCTHVEGSGICIFDGCDMRQEATS